MNKNVRPPLPPGIVNAVAPLILNNCPHISPSCEPNRRIVLDCTSDEPWWKILLPDPAFRDRRMFAGYPVSYSTPQLSEWLPRWKRVLFVISDESLLICSLSLLIRRGWFHSQRQPYADTFYIRNTPLFHSFASSSRISFRWQSQPLILVTPRLFHCQKFAAWIHFRCAYRAFTFVTSVWLGTWTVWRLSMYNCPTRPARKGDRNI